MNYEMKCENCMYWARNWDGDRHGYNGRCKFHAPVPQMVGELGGDAEVNSLSWPTTALSEWCGQWKGSR